MRDSRGSTDNSPHAPSRVCGSGEVTERPVVPTSHTFSRTCNPMKSPFMEPGERLKSSDHVRWKQAPAAAAVFLIHFLSFCFPFVPVTYRTVKTLVTPPPPLFPSPPVRSERPTRVHSVPSLGFKRRSKRA